MNLKNKTSQKLISTFLIILILIPTVLFSMPQKANAQVDPTAVPVADKVNAINTTNISKIKTKELLKEVLREALRTAARRLLAQMTQSTVNWINTGFHGQPLFLERPGSFFKDIAKSEIRDLVNIVGYNSSSFPFGKSTAIRTIEGYKSTFAQNAQYSLSKVINDPVLLNNYRNDFSVGGWDGFMLNTQFPQNNYIGFQTLYSDELARRIAGTTPNQADIVNATLAQGQGFLSPQTCETNPKYNNLKNQFQQPSFKYPIKPPDYNCDGFDLNTVDGLSSHNQCVKVYEQAVYTYEQNKAIAQEDWAVTNACPLRKNGTSGFVNTTPGSVVGSQIMRAVNSPFSQTELGMAMGNSLAAIFDALLNKFMSSGLNALSNKVNGTNNQSDDFNYYGHTLGSSPNNGNNTGLDWGGPDEIIVLSTFKKNVQNAIDNANQELKLINNNDLNDPGLFQIFDKIAPKTQELDTCLPGPNLGWQDRLDGEVQKRIADANYETISSAANVFKEWLDNKIKIELPNSTSYLNAVNSVKTINERTTELATRENVIVETLIKLESIKTSLTAITTQPAVGSQAENTMVRLRQRMDGMILDLSSSNTVSGMQNAVDDAKDKLTNLNTMIIRCTSERTGKGWMNPGGENSLFNNSQTEKELLCGSFGNTSISCDAVFKTDITDYKKNIPGT